MVSGDEKPEAKRVGMRLNVITLSISWEHSSAGRASALQAEVGGSSPSVPTSIISFDRKSSVKSAYSNHSCIGYIR